MCDFTECEHTKKSSGSAGAEWLVKAPFMFIGGCVALVLVVGVVRMVLPWLAGGLAVVFGVVCAAAVVVTVRRRRRLRRLVPAPLPTVARTVVEAVEVRAVTAPRGRPAAIRARQRAGNVGGHGPP